MAGDDHGCARVDSLTKHRVEFVATIGVEPGVWFIEQPQLGPTGDQTRQRRTTLLTGRQLGDRNTSEPAIDTQSPHRCRYFFVSRPNRRTPESHILGNGQIGVQPVAMSKHPDPRANRLTLSGKIEPKHTTDPALDRQQAGTEPQQAGLPSPIRATQQHNLTRPNGQRSSCQDRKAAEHGNGVFQRDHRVEP